MSNRKLPIGTRDEFGSVAQQKEQVIEKIQRYFRQRGFQKINTPLLEYREVFKPLAPQAYQPYQLLDERGDTLVLRPDLTLPVARVMSTTGIEIPMKWYYSGDIFRVKKRLSGSYNQITQAGIEIIGYASLKAEWECLTAASQLVQAMGIDDMTVELSHAQFVPRVLAALPLNDLAKHNLEAALYDKDLERYSQQIAPLSNDPFYPFLQNWPWLFGDFKTVLAGLDQLPAVPQLQSIIADLKATQQFMQTQFPSQAVTLDLSIQPPQEYYTGMVFHGFSQNNASFLFSGGRYDQLLASFQQTMQPAVGLAFDVDALVERLPELDTAPATLIYFEPTQWAEATAKQKALPNSSLCLADSVAAAQRIATQKGATLIDLSQEAAK